MGELLEEDIFPFRNAHDELLVSREDRSGGDIHCIDSIKKPCETFLGGIAEVVVECHEQDRLTKQNCSDTVNVDPKLRTLKI